jgi:hypothetical protein
METVQEHPLVEQPEAPRYAKRQPQWIYVGMVLGAPFAHWCVTALPHIKTVPLRKAVLYGGVVGSTGLMLFNRGFLMWHAGYTGGDSWVSPSRRIER